MITVIKNAHVYQPENAGKRDVLIVDGKIGAVAENLSVTVENAADIVKVVDGTGKVLVPCRLLLFFFLIITFQIYNLHSYICCLKMKKTQA